MYGTAETISIPSVNEEKNGRGWMNNIAGPPLDTFTTLRQTASEDTTQPYPQYLSLNKQPFKGAKFQQDSNLARLKTALDDDVEESDSEDLAYTQNIDYNFSDGEELTARFKLATQDRCVTLDFSDADDRGIDIDLEDNESYEEEKNNQITIQSGIHFMVTIHDAHHSAINSESYLKDLYTNLSPHGKENPKIY
ncbi:hypothetical protein TWF132_000930 [Orbilia oligospora]|nr:hypothetical protein TWF132_000930 [Orbilia oligospora]